MKNSVYRLKPLNGKIRLQKKFFRFLWLTIIADIPVDCKAGVISDLRLFEFEANVPVSEWGQLHIILLKQEVTHDTNTG